MKWKPQRLNESEKQTDIFIKIEERMTVEEIKYETEIIISTSSKETKQRGKKLALYLKSTPFFVCVWEFQEIMWNKNERNPTWSYHFNKSNWM